MTKKHPFSARTSRAIRRKGFLGGISLRWRILAVNIFAIAILTGSFIYLDSYKSRIISDHLQQAEKTTQIMAFAMANMTTKERRDYILTIGKSNMLHIRVYGENGDKIDDNFEMAAPSFAFIDPAEEPWRKHAARFLDVTIDTIMLAPDTDAYKNPLIDNANAWPEVQRAMETGDVVALYRFAPDRTPVISSAQKWTNSQNGEKFTLLTSYNAREITRTIRDERFTLSMIILITTMLTILLSLYLARTIASPLRLLARAAQRVRLGRAREVVVPRLPERKDEIGMLARALSDMTSALRDKIDATEAFAADVSHEIKNPLASLRSAIEGMGNIKDEDLRRQLLKVAEDDVIRLDRLITDISEASRVDAQLTRTTFEPIDMGDMIDNLLIMRESTGMDKGRDIAFARPQTGIAIVMGEGTRLERVLTNLLDNAISFSPENGLVQISATKNHNVIEITIADEGPGVPESEREMIFKRFHSMRPEQEGFGKHSGLGLAIARTIIAAHDGEIYVQSREDGKNGACFKIKLPAAQLSRYIYNDKNDWNGHV